MTAILEIAQRSDQEHQRCGSCQRAIKLKELPSDKPKKSAHIYHVNEIAIRWDCDEIRKMVREGFAIRDLVSRREQKLVTPDGANGISTTAFDPSQPTKMVCSKLWLRQGTTEHQKARRWEAFPVDCAAQEVMAMAKT